MSQRQGVIVGESPTSMVSGWYLLRYQQAARIVAYASLRVRSGDQVSEFGAVVIDCRNRAYASHTVGFSGSMISSRTRSRVRPAPRGVLRMDVPPPAPQRPPPAIAGVRHALRERDRADERTGAALEEP